MQHVYVVASLRDFENRPIIEATNMPSLWDWLNIPDSAVLNWDSPATRPVESASNNPSPD